MNNSNILQSVVSFGSLTKRQFGVVVGGTVYDINNGDILMATDISGTAPLIEHLRVVQPCHDWRIDFDADAPASIVYANARGETLSTLIANAKMLYSIEAHAPHACEPAPAAIEAMANAVASIANCDIDEAAALVAEQFNRAAQWRREAALKRGIRI